jgi:hypothetical protein
MSVIWSGITEEGAVVPVQVTEEGKVVAVGDGPQGDYLPITGGNLTGDLTIGTDKIELNADGSADFASGNAKIGRLGNIDVYREGSSAASTLAVFRSDVGSVKNDVVVFKGDGSATFAGRVTQGDPLNGSVGGRWGTVISYGGNPSNNDARASVVLTAQSDSDANASAFQLTRNGAVPFIVTYSGAATFSNNKCGFTSDGELIFSSRGTRYKLFVSQGVCQAEEYTREMELKEKAEQFVADKRETKPSEPGVTADKRETKPSEPGVTPDNDNA